MPSWTWSYVRRTCVASRKYRMHISETERRGRVYGALAAAAPAARRALHTHLPVGHAKGHQALKQLVIPSDAR